MKLSEFPLPKLNEPSEHFATQSDEQLRRYIEVMSTAEKNHSDMARNCLVMLAMAVIEFQRRVLVN